MNDYSTTISAEAMKDGKVIAKITVEHYGLDYEGLVKVESSIQMLINEQFSWGPQRIEAASASTSR